jgi:hypothetical protein
MRTSRQAGRGTAVAVVAGLLLVNSACGFVLTQAPPQGHERLPYFSCTQSNAGPIIDVIWGGLNILGALAASGDPNSAYYSNNRGQVVAVGLAWGVVSGSSAIVGFGKTSRCRTAMRQLAERQMHGLVGVPSPQADSSVVALAIAPAVDTLRVGARVQLIAVAHGSSGQSVPNRTFSWSSSNDAIASVNAAGLVTANAPGSVIVAARTGSVVGTASVTVLPPQ